MSDEQRVRTMAGWIGVEISRSRVRTPGKAGYGLYRVRGQQLVRGQVSTPSGTTISEPYWASGTWTAYAFELDVIEAQIDNAIGMGTPAGPGDLYLPKSRVGAGELPYATVPTRWTSAYRGPRTLGVAVPAELKPEARHRVSALAALVDEGLVAMRHDGEGCSCSGTERLTMRCVNLTMQDETARQAVRVRQAAGLTAKDRQRAQNAEFQREHKARRDWGLKRRHARKEAHNARIHNAEEGR